MSKHPLTRRARRLASHTRERGQAYADGAFFFTRPVGAPVGYPEGQAEVRNMSPRGEYAVATGYTSGGEFLGDFYADGANTREGGYGDGGFYFLQKMGEPAGGYGDVAMVEAAPSYGDVASVVEETPVLRMGFAGAVESQYGRTGATTPRNPTEQGAAPRFASGSGNTSGGQTAAVAAAVAVAPPDVVARFEEAVIGAGRRDFWVTFWSAPDRAASSLFSEPAKAEKAASAHAQTSANEAVRTAQQVLLAGVPSFDLSRTGGLPQDRAGKAFMAYTDALRQTGFYAEAYRNAKNPRVAAKGVFDFLLRDYIQPYAHASWKSKPNVGYPVWVTKNVDSRPYVAAVQAVILADAQSEFRKGLSNWKGKGTLAAKTVRASAYALELPGETFDTDFKTDQDRKNFVLMRASDTLQNLVFTENFSRLLAAKRKEQDGVRATLADRLAAARTEWEAARKESVERAAALAQATRVVTSGKATADAAALRAKNSADIAKNKRTEAETKALGLDVPGTETAAAAATAAATQADSSAKQAEAALTSAEAAFRTLGDAGTDAKTAFQSVVTAARTSARDAAIDAQSAVARIESAKAAKKAADDKAAAEAAAREAAIAQQKVDTAQRNLDAAKERLARLQAEQTAPTYAQMPPQQKQDLAARISAAQTEVDLAQRALDEAKGTFDLAKYEQERLARVAEEARKNAETLDQRAQDLGEKPADLKVPPGAMQPRRKFPMEKIGVDDSRAGKEGFFSKHRTELILGAAVLGIGGYFAWQRYGKKP